MKRGPEKGSLKDEILQYFGLATRQGICFEDDADDGNGEVEDWKEGLPEDIKGDKSLTDYKLGEDEEGVSVPVGLIKSYVGQQKLIGSKITLPGEEASEEELDKFYESINMARPKTADDYEFTVDEKFAELPHSDDLEQWFRDFAHKERIPTDKADRMYQGYQEQMLALFDGANTEMEKENVDATATLEKKWGSKAKENTELADRAFHTLFPEDKLSERVRLLLGNDAVFVGRMFEISNLINESKFVLEEGQDITTGVKTREELRAMKQDPRYETDVAFQEEVTREYEKLAVADAAQK